MLAGVFSGEAERVGRLLRSGVGLAVKLDPLLEIGLDPLLEIGIVPLLVPASRSDKEVPMSDWTPHDVDRIGATPEIDIAPRRPDGTLRPYTTIWVVAVGNNLYVRSYRGSGGSWYQAAQQTHEGRICTGGVEHDVTLHAVGDIEPTTVDDAYRAKYGRSIYVDAMITPAAAATTLRVTPR